MNCLWEVQQGMRWYNSYAVPCSFCVGHSFVFCLFQNLNSALCWVLNRCRRSRHKSVLSESGDRSDRLPPAIRALLPLQSLDCVRSCLRGRLQSFKRSSFHPLPSTSLRRISLGGGTKDQISQRSRPNSYLFL